MIPVSSQVNMKRNIVYRFRIEASRKPSIKPELQIQYLSKYLHSCCLQKLSQTTLWCRLYVQRSETVAHSNLHSCPSFKHMQAKHNHKQTKKKTKTKKNWESLIKSISSFPILPPSQSSSNN